MRCFRVAPFTRLCFLLLFVCSSFAPTVAFGERGAPELRVCSQNLHRYGEQRDAEQERHLIERFRFARCDVIGVQEVFGESDDDGREHLERLALRLSQRTGRSFQAVIGKSQRDLIRNGFLFDQKQVELKRILQPESYDLPKLSLRGPADRFSRLPVGVLLTVKRREGEANGIDAPKRRSQKNLAENDSSRGNIPSQPLSREVLIVTIHLKSRVNGWRDPTGTSFETVRMEMSEAIRQWVESEQSALSKPPLTIVLGDRNSEEFTASAAILRGSLSLADFREGCRVSSSGSFGCTHRLEREPQFTELLAEAAKRQGESFRSYRYKGKAMQLDDILIDASSEWVTRSEGDSRHVGAVGDFSRASDHKLLWVELNW